MARRPLLLIVLSIALVAFVATASACSSGRARAVERAPLTTSSSLAPSTVAPTAVAPSTVASTVAPAGEVKALVTATGVVVPVLGGAEGAWRVGTPCGAEAVVRTGAPIRTATVVIDAGHGGRESGAVGPNGLTEKALNLAVARLVQADLTRTGEAVVLTRTGDYAMPLASRTALVQRLNPAAFVSVHHNGVADGSATKPGTETYYQSASPASKRLAGLLYEDIYAAFASRPGVEWHANVDAGAKYRLNSRGGDYYGVLRMSAGIPSVISEGLFLSTSRTEADLLARPDVQAAEASAIARAIRRFLHGRDPGSGFVTPIPRDTPTTGGSADGCVDPPLQ